MKHSPLLLMLLFTACATTVEMQPPSRTVIPTPIQPSSEPYRSETCHLEVALPTGWAAVEGPEPLTEELQGLIAFNNWGDEDFWAREMTRGDQTFYSPMTTLSQLPRRAAYIVLASKSGDPPYEVQRSTPDYSGQDLSALWNVEDCRKTKFATWPGVSWIEFVHGDRHLRLEVYCNPYSADQTAAQVKALLESWRFDESPTDLPSSQGFRIPSSCGMSLTFNLPPLK